MAMPIDPQTTMGPPHRSDPKAASKDKAADTDETAKTTVETIREMGGFRAFVENLQEERARELRAKLLEAMGLTEEQLAEMPPEQRAEIEKVIAQEIRDRMMAASVINSDKPFVQATTPSEAAGQMAAAPEAGLGPLLAMQEGVGDEEDETR